jgi:hypothetical protein
MNELSRERVFVPLGEVSVAWSVLQTWWESV